MEFSIVYHHETCFFMSVCWIWLFDSVLIEDTGGFSWSGKEFAVSLQTAAQLHLPDCG